MIFKLPNTFYTGEIGRDEFERLIFDIIGHEMLGVIIFDIVYNERGIEVKTDRGEIEIEIDWDEILIKEPDEPIVIE